MTDTPTTVALVTGSTSGIGEATARRLAARGIHVIVNSAHSVASGRALAEELGGSYVQGDIGTETGAHALVEEAVGLHGRLDLLVNNAGTTTRIPLEDLEAATSEVWDTILSVNLMGTWHVTTAAVEALTASPHGAVVNVTSVAGLRPQGSSIPYAVSKAAINHLTLLLAKALAPAVRVNAVAPGVIDTPWNADGPSTASPAPLGARGAPDTVADAIEFLLFNTYTTGEVVRVDGGLILY